MEDPIRQWPENRYVLPWNLKTCYENINSNTSYYRIFTIYLDTSGQSGSDSDGTSSTTEGGEDEDEDDEV